MALAATLGCSGASTPPLSAPLGIDAGAGCDSTIHAHCVFAHGIGEPLLSSPVCIEYSGASLDHSSCTFGDSLAILPGQYASGPCPRDQYDKACVYTDVPTPDAGACTAFQTIWSDSSEWNPDAGLIGYPACFAVVN